MNAAITAVALAAGAGGSLLFLMGFLEPKTGEGAVFAAVFLCLVVAACAGPCCFGRPRDAALRCALLGTVAAIVCGTAALARDGPLLAALACGLFAGLFGFALGAAADGLGGGLARVAVAAAGLAAITTLFYWDGAFLLAAADRKASADLAFRLSPAAAASVTVGFDWLHATALYTSNETAESMVGVPVGGIGPYSLWLAALAGAGLLAGRWRRR